MIAMIKFYSDNTESHLRIPERVSFTGCQLEAMIFVTSVKMRQFTVVVSSLFSNEPLALPNLE